MLAMWAPIDSPPTPRRSYHACAYDPVNDMIYMYGGCHGLEGYDTTLCQRYDPASNDWVNLAPMSVPRVKIKGIYCQGRLYAMGGQHGSMLQSCEAYDIASNTWSPVAPLPCPNMLYSAITWRDSLIFLMGGFDAGENWTDSVRVYNPSTNTWSTATSMPAPSSVGDACIIGDTIYFAGTWAEQSEDSLMRVGAINPTDPAQITWSWGRRLPSRRYNGPTVALGGKVYWFGGVQSPGGVTPAAYVYDPAVGMIDAAPYYPRPVACCCLGVAREGHDQIYGLAGQGEGYVPVGYYKLVFTGYHNVGATQIWSPIGEIDSGNVVRPSALLANLGTDPESFEAMFRIGDVYTDRKSVYLTIGEIRQVWFAPGLRARRAGSPPNARRYSPVMLWPTMTPCRTHSG